MMQTYRIFVSSPGDAQFERQRVDRVVARLNGELAGAARFVTVRWETEFYRADRTFQAQIATSSSPFSGRGSAPSCRRISRACPTAIGIRAAPPMRC
jgi:hypothetical protein